MALQKSTGRTIIAEAYGSSGRSIHYVKPPGKPSIVPLESDSGTSVKEWFTDIFMPQGYPDSVSADYLNYQMWDTAQAFCSTITGILATQEVLRGVGVGSNEASVLAATITWVLKDGCGHLGRILFAYSYGWELDSYSKIWRLYADILNDAAMCIELFLSYFGGYTTIVLCISTIMRAIVGVSGGATRVAMTQHHAIRNNLGDVSAKDSAQETAVNLIGSLVALFIITVFSNSIIMIVFGLMVTLHIVCNYHAVRAVCLRTLNEPRYLLYLERYICAALKPLPHEINALEPALCKLSAGRTHTSGIYASIANFKIIIGCSLKEIMNIDEAYLSDLIQVYSECYYVIIEDFVKGKLYIFLSIEAKTEDILRAYYHAIMLNIYINTTNDYPKAVYISETIAHEFSLMSAADVEKFRQPLLEGPEDLAIKYRPTKELHLYVRNVVRSQWDQVKSGLENGGWDLSQHLLVVGEWRIVNENYLMRSHHDRRDKKEK